MSARSASAPWPISRRFGRADAAGLTGRVRREVVVVHVALGLLGSERVDLLRHLHHVQRGDAQDLGLAALEQRASRGRAGSRRPRRDSERMSVMPRPSMRKWSVRMRWRTSFLVSERNAAPISFSRPSNFGPTSLEHLGLERVGGGVALLLAGDRQRLRPAWTRRRPRRRRKRRPGRPGTAGTRRWAWRRASASSCLRLAQRGDERLRGLEALGDNGLGRRACAPPAMSSMTFSVASASTIMIATSASLPLPTRCGRRRPCRTRRSRAARRSGRRPTGRRSAPRGRRRRGRRTAGPRAGWTRRRR